MFSFVVDVELWGIPAHAWELEVTAQLLGDACVPYGLHPTTASQREVFRLSAWCSDPSDIPPWMELELPELAVASVHDEQVQRLLSYPITIVVNVNSSLEPFSSNHGKGFGKVGPRANVNSSCG